MTATSPRSLPMKPPAASRCEVMSRGELCATGSAALPASATAPPVAEFQSATPPAHDARAPADETSLAVGRWLGMTPLAVTARVSRAGSQRHARDRPAVRCGRHRPSRHHPALLQLGAVAQRRASGVDHVGSKVQHLGIAHIGDTLSARARVTQNYVHKGHKFVEVDALVLANERTPLARVTHTAIYLPRQLAEAA